MTDLDQYEASLPQQMKEQIRVAGSRVFSVFGNTSPWGSAPFRRYGGYERLAKGLGGVQAYGKNTPITAAMAAEVLGVTGNDFAWFLDICPS